MKITLHHAPLTAEQAHWTLVGRQALDHLWAKLREVSFATERRVKDAMPVDTGRARASWGHWSPGDIHDNSEAGAGDAHWKEDRADLSTEQGSNVEYVPGLNEGHSQQAPAGFIDKAEEDAGRLLEQEVDEILQHWSL